MAYKDLADFFDPDLHLPIRGKKYRVPAPSYEDSKRMRITVLDGTIPIPQLLGETVDALGSALDEMVADDIPWTMILHAGRTALMHFGATPELAEAHWSLAQLGRSVDLDILPAALAKSKA